MAAYGSIHGGQRLWSGLLIFCMATYESIHGGQRLCWFVDILVAQGQPSWKQGSPVTTKPHLYD